MSGKEQKIMLVELPTLFNFGMPEKLISHLSWLFSNQLSNTKII
jgi:hypothetical protein